MTVISSTILALKDPAMSKLKNSTDLAIDKYNNLIVRDNGEKEKFSLWMEDFSIWLGKIIIDPHHELLHLVMVCNCLKGQCRSLYTWATWPGGMGRHKEVKFEDFRDSVVAQLRTLYKYIKLPFLPL